MHLALSLCPRSAHTSHLQRHPLSRKPPAALPVKLGERQQAGGHCTAARNGVPSKAPPAPTQSSTAGALLSALGSSLGMQNGMHDVALPRDLCDTCSPCNATVLLHGVVLLLLLQGDTLGFLPTLLVIRRAQHQMATGASKYCCGL